MPHPSGCNLLQMEAGIMRSRGVLHLMTIDAGLARLEVCDETQLSASLCDGQSDLVAERPA